MNWRVEFTERGRKDLKGLPIQVRRRIVDFLQKRIVARDDPKSLATRLVGSHQPLWRLRVGDYRIIARFDDGTFIVLVISVGHRRDIYRGS